MSAIISVLLIVGLKLNCTVDCAEVYAASQTSPVLLLRVFHIPYSWRGSHRVLQLPRLQ